MAPLALLGLWIAASASAAVDQPTFSSAKEAAQSLFQAVQSNDEHAIGGIIDGPTELNTSTDPGHDKAERDLFVRKYQEMHRLHREPDGSSVLYIGAENWPFPVPLVNTNGVWRFDPEAGKSEVLFRRICENELTAIANCREFAAAGSNAPAGISPASAVAKAIMDSAGGHPVLLDGYYFRLTPMSPGSGIALIAYPAEYRSSGVMTFVAKDGLVYEKDLGENTTRLAGAMAAFQKDHTWKSGH
jgi:hypothetical protein